MPATGKAETVRHFRPFQRNRAVEHSAAERTLCRESRDVRISTIRAGGRIRNAGRAGPRIVESNLTPSDHPLLALLTLLALLVWLDACSRGQSVRAGHRNAEELITTVGVTTVTRKAMMRQITLSSELVPFQEIDVYAKEAGYVKDLLVDYGSRVQKGQLMAVLEIPELEVQLKQDAAAIQSADERVTRAHHELNREEAEHRVAHLQADRLTGVAKTRPGLVAGSR
jgi:multidrug efflux pump subunit AcrA (membrane-fusion protein)